MAAFSEVQAPGRGPAGQPLCGIEVASLASPPGMWPLFASAPAQGVAAVGSVCDSHAEDTRTSFSYLFYQPIHFSLQRFAVCTRSFNRDKVMAERYAVVLPLTLVGSR